MIVVMQSSATEQQVQDVIERVIPAAQKFRREAKRAHCVLPANVASQRFVTRLQDRKHRVRHIVGFEVELLTNL